jgi:hypothetical protein
MGGLHCDACEGEEDLEVDVSTIETKCELRAYQSVE